MNTSLIPTDKGESRGGELFALAMRRPCQRLLTVMFAQPFMMADWFE